MGFSDDLQAEFDSARVSMFRRLAVRTFILAALTAVAFMGMDLLVMMGHDRITDINERWPELIQVLRAAGILTWAEMSLMWIRMALAPKTDVQQAANVALQSPTAAAVVYATHSLQWMVRMVFFLRLCGFL